jgi:hypothetical protein
MNKSYSLSPLNMGPYAYISFSLTSERLDDYYSELENELKQLAVKGKVLLDLLSSNGVKAQRFVSLYFDGNHFSYSSFENIESVSDDIESISHSFYKEHLYAVENSVLTKPQKFLFKKKLALLQLH